MIVAYQGVPGAFGHEAAGQVAGVVERRALERFAHVIDAVKGRAADRGVLPVSNRYAGPVDGIPGPAVAECARQAGADVVLTLTACYV